jgi:hypothetical protein
MYQNIGKSLTDWVEKNNALFFWHDFGITK